MVDENKNVKANFNVNGEEHVLNLNAKLTERGITLTTRNKKLHVWAIRSYYK